MAVKYIAGKQLKVGDSFRQIGEEIPEAASWPTLSSYVNMGHVVVVADGLPTPGASTTHDPDYTARGQELSGKKKDELKAIAKGHDVPIYGSKADIIDRILSAEFD